VTDRASFWALFWQFFKFGLVGLSNTAVSMGIYYLFLWIDPALYMVGSILGTIVSIANAFFWNDRFVFTGNARDFKSVMRRMGKTYVSYGGTSILSNVLLWLEVSVFGVSKVIAPVVNLLITIPLNFIINKFWTFAKGSSQPDTTQNAADGAQGDADKTEEML
jgi:putative flippase GtrA